MQIMTIMPLKYMARMFLKLEWQWHVYVSMAQLNVYIYCTNFF